MANNNVKKFENLYKTLKSNLIFKEINNKKLEKYNYD